MTMAKTTINFIFYILLFGLTVFINKYVLSVLCFTYPTIYQGWQTLIGGILLHLLLYKTAWLAVSPTPIDKAGFISLLPSFLFFVAGIVASSKALASLSIGMFLCLHSALASVLYILEVFPSLYKWSTLFLPSLDSNGFTCNGSSEVSKLGVAAALLSLLTTLVAVLLELEKTVGQLSDSPYLWLIVSLTCVAVQRLHSRIADARYNAVDRLCSSYVFSVIVLAPASLYLEEAFEVLHFQHASRLDFMGACLLVGVLALLLALQTITIQQHAYFSKVEALSRLLTSVVSVGVFPSECQVAGPVLALALLTQALGLLVPGVKVPSINSQYQWTAVGKEDLLSVVESSA